MIGDDFRNTKINVWVQLHCLPFKLRNEIFVKDLAGIAGKVKDNTGSSSTSANRYGGEFLKFCIELDMKEPIIHGFFLQRDRRNPVWIHLKYIKLPSVYFYCGKLNHEKKPAYANLAEERNCTGDGFGQKTIYRIYQFGLQIRMVSELSNHFLYWR